MISPIRIEIEENLRRFRMKSEIKNVSHHVLDRKRSQVSHGNYITGKIILPENLPPAIYKLQLCLIPSLDSDPAIFKAHPNVLHLTNIHSYDSMHDICKESWRLVLDLDWFNKRLCLKSSVNNQLLELPVKGKFACESQEK